MKTKKNTSTNRSYSAFFNSITVGTYWGISSGSFWRFAQECPKNIWFPEAK